MQTTIVEHADALRGKAQKKKRLQEQQERQTDFQNRERDFREHARRLRALVSTYRLFKAHDVDFEERRGTVRETLDLLRKIRDRFQEESTYVIDRQGSLRPLWRKIDSHCQGLRRILEDGWHRYVREHAPGQDEEVLDVLGRIPDFEAPVQRIRKQTKRLLEKKQTLPRTKEDLDAVHELCQSVEKAWQSIGSGDLSEDVIAFIKAAASQSGASLDLLTSGVRDWLEQEGLTESFAVRVGRD
jgi:DNA repair exonuclease SbcCD ATPase subunit